MSLVLPGDPTTSNLFDAGATIARASQMAFLHRYYEPGQGGFSYFAQDGNFFRVRKNGELSARFDIASWTTLFTSAAIQTVGWHTVLMVVDFTAGDIDIYVDSDTPVFSSSAYDGDQMYDTTVTPNYFGSDTDGEDYELMAGARWIGSNPTAGDITALMAGDIATSTLSGLTNPPTHAIAPAGDGSTYVSAVAADIGTLGFTHTQGPVDTDNFPYSNAAAVVSQSPTDIYIGADNAAAYTIADTAGANAVIGTVVGVDADTVTGNLTVTLVAGTGDTDNGSFNFNGQDLRCTDPLTLGAGTYSILIQAEDPETNTYQETLSITVTNTGIVQVVEDSTGTILADAVNVNWVIAANYAGLAAGTILATGTTAVAGGSGAITIDDDSVGTIGGTCLMVVEAGNEWVVKPDVSVIDLGA